MDVDRFLVEWTRHYSGQVDRTATPPPAMAKQVARLITNGMLAPGRSHVLYTNDAGTRSLSYEPAVSNPSWSVTFTPIDGGDR